LLLVEVGECQGAPSLGRVPTPTPTSLTAVVLHDTHPHRTPAPADTLAIMGVPFEALLPYAIMTGVC
jgi:hypothetical protein